MAAWPMVRDGAARLLTMRSRGAATRDLSLNALPDHDPLGAVVPDVHLHDLAAAHHEAVDIAIAFKRCTVRPFAVQRACIVDNGLAMSRAHVGALHLLLHPFIAPGI